MNTQILYTVLFVTDNQYFKYIYIMFNKTDFLEKIY